jgi:MFS superfamily sulfate permease-like transporter
MGPKFRRTGQQLGSKATQHNRGAAQMKEGIIAVINSKPSRLQKALLSVRADFLPSVAVFLVALPLCMGIAIASGVPVAAGLITGIVGGLVVGVLAGAPLQVSGPAAGLTVVIYEIVQKYGLESLGAIVLMAGMLQIVAGVFKLGQWFRAVSPAVIKGMLAGIGVLILASQFHVMVDDKPKENGIQNLIAIPQAIAKGLPLPEPSTEEQRERRTKYLKIVGLLHERQTEIQEAVAEAVPKDAGEDFEVPAEFKNWLVAEQQELTADVGAVAEEVRKNHFAKTNTGESAKAANTVVAASKEALGEIESQNVDGWLATQQLAADSLAQLNGSLKSHQWAAKVGLLTILVLLVWQGFTPKRLKAIPAPLIAVVIATAAAVIWSLPVLYVEVPDSLLSAMHLPSTTLFENNAVGGLLGAAIVIALIASAETLLCATAVDQMHNGQRTQYDRELVAQGIGNSICGFLGALPMTGVIVRSAANIQAGGTSRASAIMHGVWLLVFVGLLGFVLRSIPIASLAAILVYTGYKLVNLKQVKELAKYGWGEVFIYFATMISIVVTDLLTGVVVGVVLSAAKLLYTFAHLETRLKMEPESNRTVLSLVGTATFLRLPRLAAALEKVPANNELHVDFEQLEYIDHACLDLLMNWAKQHQSLGGRLVIDWDSLHANFRGESPTAKRSVA